MSGSGLACALDSLFQFQSSKKPSLHTPQRRALVWLYHKGVLHEPLEVMKVGCGLQGCQTRMLTMPPALSGLMVLSISRCLLPHSREGSREQQRESVSSGQESGPQRRGTGEPGCLPPELALHPAEGGVPHESCPSPSLTLTPRHVFDPSPPVEEHGAMVVDMQEGDLLRLLP